MNNVKEKRSKNAIGIIETEQIRCSRPHRGRLAGSAADVLSWRVGPSTRREAAGAGSTPFDVSRFKRRIVGLTVEEMALP